MFECHHSMSDGIGLIMMFLKFQSEVLPEQLPSGKPLTIAQKVMLYLTLPYYYVRIFIRVFKAPYARNPIKGETPSGIRRCTISSDYSFPQLKALSKAQSCSFNDLCLTVTSMVLRRIFVANDRSDI